jgi:hypothetical protein
MRGSTVLWVTSAFPRFYSEGRIVWQGRLRSRNCGACFCGKLGLIVRISSDRDNKAGLVMDAMGLLWAGID